MPLARPLCALQVRRGDKHIEAQLAPLEQYMVLLVNATAAAGCVWNGVGACAGKAPPWRFSSHISYTTQHSMACRTIFVATDDQVGVLPALKADAKSAFPGARVTWLRSRCGVVVGDEWMD